jgi:hypothetical protein
MAIQLTNDNFYLNAGKPLDDKFGPYISPTAANTAIPQAQRHAGLIFGVYTTPGDIPNSDVEYYYYYGNFSNSEYAKLIKPTLQQVTTNGNTTTAKIVHADATANNESATLGQVIQLISNATGGVTGDFVPYTGATKNIILGDFSITADSYRFDLTPVSTQAKGRLLWNENNGSLTLGLNNNLVNTIGLDNYVLVRNQTGTTIQKGRVVSILGSNSTNEKILITPSVGNGTINTNRILGVTAENIDNNQNGYVVVRGRVSGINTTGSIYSQTWADGDLIYLNSTLPGGLTNTRPIGSNLKGLIGVVVKADSSNGILEINQNLTHNLGDLNNVTIGTVSNRNILLYNSTSGVWDNRTLAYLLNGTASQFVKGNGTLDSTQYQPLITGGATTITSTNLTNNRTLISDNLGKVAVSPVTSTELLSLTGITGNIQTQINNILSGPTVSDIILKEGFVYVSGMTVTLSENAEEIHSIIINGQYIPDDYYSLLNNVITFNDIIFETEPQPDQILVYYFKELT